MKLLINFLNYQQADYSTTQFCCIKHILQIIDHCSFKILSEEAVELDYIELRSDSFREAVEEQMIVDAYEQEIANSQYQTENRVSHILFEQGGDESDSSYQERLSDAQSRLAAGEAFAAVALKGML